MTFPIPLRLQAASQNSSQQLVRLWTITRTDGVVVRFTDHDVDVNFGGDTYSPAGGFDASATEHQHELAATNKEYRGVVLENEAIQFEDLQAGRYSGASITEEVVDWTRSPATVALAKYEYVVDRVQWNGERFDAEVGDTRLRLRQKIGRSYTKACDVEALGDSRCKVDLDLMELSGRSVTAIIDRYIQVETDIPSSVLDVNGNSTTHENGWFDHGQLTWLTGNNTGLSSPIARSLVADGSIILQIPTPFEIQTGDTFDITPGCNRSLSVCRDKFNNVVNHRGFPYIPGTDAVLRTPNAK